MQTIIELINCTSLLILQTILLTQPCRTRLSSFSLFCPLLWCKLTIILSHSFLSMENFEAPCLLLYSHLPITVIWRYSSSIFLLTPLTLFGNKHLSGLSLNCNICCPWPMLLLHKSRKKSWSPYLFFTDTFLLLTTLVRDAIRHFKVLAYIAIHFFSFIFRDNV